MYFKIPVPLFPDQKNSSMIIGYGFILENPMIIMACNWFYFKIFTIVVVNVCIVSGWRSHLQKSTTSQHLAHSTSKAKQRISELFETFNM